MLVTLSFEQFHARERVNAKERDISVSCLVVRTVCIVTVHTPGSSGYKELLVIYALRDQGIVGK